MHMKAAGDEVAVDVGMSPAEEYERSLNGLKKISLVTDIMTVCNWSLGFCALTWASAVLLGAYIEDLRVWDYYDVSVLLFVEGLRFGVAALIRMLGIYQIPSAARFFLRSAQLFVPLWMGGFALLSILPVHVRDNIEDHFYGPINEQVPSTHITAVGGHHAHSPYKSLSASLTIFYSLILANAIVLLIGNTITGSMRKIYVHSHAKSLHHYHDKLLLENSSWMHAGVDLDFAFKMQSLEYKRGKPVHKICKDYLDVICYLYMHEKGVEVAEAALEADDVYVREAAAHMVGFWAVWEKMKGCSKLVPLHYQGQLLSLLVDVAEERYGATSSAAAYSLGLLMEKSTEEDVERMLAVLKRKEKKLVRMLLQRAVVVLKAPKGYVSKVVRENSSCHMYALAQLGGGWRNVPDQLAARLGELAEHEEGAAAQLLQEVQPHLSSLLSQQQNDADLATLKQTNDLVTLEEIMKKERTEPLWRRSLKTAVFVLLNVAVPLTLGFIVKALIRH